MIFDEFKNLYSYPNLPFLQEIQHYVASQDCTQIPEGQHEILGLDLFVRVAEYATGPAAEKQFEAHTIYADLQFVVSGAEVMEVSLEENPKPTIAYNKEADIRFFENPPEISSLLVSAGHFAVFFPGELHKPGCWIHQTPVKVKKLVFKIKMP